MVWSRYFAVEVFQGDLFIAQETKTSYPHSPWAFPSVTDGASHVIVVVHIVVVQEFGGRVRTAHVRPFFLLDVPGLLICVCMRTGEHPNDKRGSYRYACRRLSNLASQRIVGCKRLPATGAVEFSAGNTKITSPTEQSDVNVRGGDAGFVGRHAFAWTCGNFSLCYVVLIDQAYSTPPHRSTCLRSKRNRYSCIATSMRRTVSGLLMPRCPQSSFIR